MRACGAELLTVTLGRSQRDLQKEVIDLPHPNIAVPGFHKTDFDTILIDLSINIAQYRSVAESRRKGFQLSVKKWG